MEIKSDGFVVCVPLATVATRADFPSLGRQEDKLHNGEVVVYSMIPKETELSAVFEDARQATSDAGRAVKVTSAADLDTPIGELIESQKRLIIVDHVHYPGSWERADSYGSLSLFKARRRLSNSSADHVSYNTVNPATIVASLEKTHSESSHPEPPVSGKPARGSIYQLQATPTADIKDDIRASLTCAGSSSSCSLTKALSHPPDTPTRHRCSPTRSRKWTAQRPFRCATHRRLKTDAGSTLTGTPGSQRRRSTTLETSFFSMTL